ncbi:Anti-sigma-K factor rskA [Actinoplanes sp. SE50]|uniref:anti-sigma factor n=1 Tax=unclassified Actinoplanes TaxID=2626549 RepID=UPI00023ED3A7|nr:MULTISPECIES: anti-sigma factor [unclassified Actinoplanes]AEV82235.1 Anti-sigma-K factor rskA [Actinoplanes sp. SE50/110]ATO80633.1 Anti-sigma-K factor rskA [Actinoplanes sp. SE50]SLL98040.1 Anti-sigma-K factor rskA [Actinoplanes sp. SE50/110]
MIADIHSLVGAYALDSVDDLERAAFERHIGDCEACRIEVAELRETTARLADSTWSAPPPRLRENVLAAIATTRQAPPLTAATPSRERAATRARMSRRQLFSAAAAVVVAAAGAGTAVYTIQDQRVRDERAAAEADRDLQARVRAILGSPDVVLRGEQLRDGGRVTVAYSRLRDAGVVTLAADGPPSGGRVYQLWTVRSRVPVDEGALPVGQSSVVKIVERMSSAEVVGVSEEPPGGSARPTDMVAGVKTI